MKLRGPSVLLLLGCLVVLAISTAFAEGKHNSSSLQAAKMSTKGQRVKVGKAELARLRRSGLGSAVFRIATRGNRAYYRFSPARNGACYGTGSAAPVSRVGIVKCWTANRPLMDLSIVEVVKDTGKVGLVGIGGVATDDVATVAVKGVDGAVLSETAVINNTYHFASVPNASVKTIEALDSSRGVVWSQVVGGA